MTMGWLPLESDCPQRTAPMAEHCEYRYLTQPAHSFWATYQRVLPLLSLRQRIVTCLSPWLWNVAMRLVQSLLAYFSYY